IAYILLDSKKDTCVREYGGYLLYNTIKTIVKPDNSEETLWNWIDTLTPFIVDADSDILCYRLCKCLCLLILTNNIFNSTNTPKQLLEIIIKASIEKKTDPDVICVSFFMALADEYNLVFLTEIQLSEIDDKIKQFIREIQAHAIKILNYDKSRQSLKISTLKCLDSWLQNIIHPKYLNFTLTTKVVDFLLDSSLSSQAFLVVHSLLNQSKYDEDFIVSLGVLLTKCLVYVFPYLTIAEVNQLNEVFCETSIQKNIFTLFISFSNLYLSKKMDDESVIAENSFNNCLKIMYRLTAVGSCATAPYHQSPDMIIYPFQFWNDFFIHDTIRRNINAPKFNYLFSELFYIFLQKITIFSWIAHDKELLEIIFNIRREVSCIFRKMASIRPELFLDNLFITYKLYEQQSLSDPKKIYLIEAAAFTLGSVISVIPISYNSIVILKEIYGSIPSLCNTNTVFIKPLLTLLSKSSTFITTYLIPVFYTMIDNITNFLIESQNMSTKESKELITVCINFISEMMDQTNIQINQEISYKLIKLFGELFGLIFQKVKLGYNFETFLTEKDRKPYILMSKIIVRSLSCMFLDGSANDAEMYVSNMLKEIFNLFSICVLSMVNTPSPSLYRDVFLLIQIMGEISQGFLVESNSGKGAIKFMFEKFFDNSLFINTYYCLVNSEIGVNILIDIIKRCIYTGFGAIVNKTALSNFVTYIMTLVYDNRWEVVPIFNTYICVLRNESNTIIEPVDFVVTPLITEDARILVLRLLDYSVVDITPVAAKLSMKCLKQAIRCSYAATDANILLMSKIENNDKKTLIEHVFTFMFSRMLIFGNSLV
ncbi:hypothetical protein MXB_5411, partial [Myxobolus squamalis]